LAIVDKLLQLHSCHSALPLQDVSCDIINARHFCHTGKPHSADEVESLSFSTKQSSRRPFNLICAIYEVVNEGLSGEELSGSPTLAPIVSSQNRYMPKQFTSRIADVGCVGVCFRT
jgi:hypothetical protein